MNDIERQVCSKALKLWGVQAQLDMMIEEMSELIKAIIKYRRGKGDKNELMREGVDVQIMMMQLETMFPPEDWHIVKGSKLSRVQELIARAETR